MSRTIHKYVLPVTDEVTIQMPLDAKVLHVGWQGPSQGQIEVWAEVNTFAGQVPHRFRIYGTGHPMEPDPTKERYIGTVQVQAFVWHVYEVSE